MRDYVVKDRLGGLVVKVQRRPGDEEEGNLGKDFPDRLKCRQSVQGWQRVVGNDQLRAGSSQRTDEILTSLDALGYEGLPPVPEFVLLELGTESGILDEEDAEWHIHDDLGSPKGAIQKEPIEAQFRDAFSNS